MFDAKYKRMHYIGTDVDREDFFQIHTYISYLQHKGNVKAAGLIYPSENENIVVKTLSSLFDSDDTRCKFIVDGPNVGAEKVHKERFLKLLEQSLI